MDGAIVVLVAGFGSMAVLSLGFAAWREVEHRKLVDTLTSKIMSKNYGEFASFRQEEAKAKVQVVKEPQKKPYIDPVLGQAGRDY